ncbi:MAG: zinc ribbon domain-containing protein, partial [Peptostreptococcaceae bacterium]
LTIKCKQNNIELRMVDKFYPSSKTCSSCGKIKKNLKLSDRKYMCSCGFICDRDLNASYNLKNAKKYKVVQLKRLLYMYGGLTSEFKPLENYIKS